MNNFDQKFHFKIHKKYQVTKLVSVSNQKCNLKHVEILNQLFNVLSDLIHLIKKFKTFVEIMIS